MVARVLGLFVLGVTLAHVAGKSVSVDKTSNDAEWTGEILSEENEADNTGNSRESLRSVDMDDKTMPEWEADDVGNSRESLRSVDTDDKTMPEWEADDVGNSRNTRSVNPKNVQAWLDRQCFFCGYYSRLG